MSKLFPTDLSGLSDDDLWLASWQPAADIIYPMSNAAAGAVPHLAAEPMPNPSPPQDVAAAPNTPAANPPSTAFAGPLPGPGPDHASSSQEVAPVPSTPHDNVPPNSAGIVLPVPLGPTTPGDPSMGSHLLSHQDWLV